MGTLLMDLGGLTSFVILNFGMKRNILKCTYTSDYLI